nr:MAG TPA: phosphoprotein [Bacteriophage sp.]
MLFAILVYLAFLCSVCDTVSPRADPQPCA